jgi:hypothetical protein
MERPFTHSESDVLFRALPLLISANPETLVGDEHDHRHGAWQSSGQGSRRQNRRPVWLNPRC